MYGFFHECYHYAFCIYVLLMSLCVCFQLGTTALDIAKELNYDDVTDILQSKTNRETGTIYFMAHM